MFVLITYDVNTGDAGGRKRLGPDREAVRELRSAGAELGI